MIIFIIFNIIISLYHFFIDIYTHHLSSSLYFNALSLNRDALSFWVMSSLTVYYSNRTEVLFEDFKENLYANSHPLSKRLVIVPSSAMKSWLINQMAKDSDLGIAAGMEMGFLEPSLSKLHSLLNNSCQSTSSSYEPSPLELALALESEITNIADSSHPSPQWSQLCRYLGPNSLRRDKRIGALAAQLASLFLNYGIYAGEMLKAWQRSALADWQGLLWQKMEEIFKTWDYPLRKFNHINISTDFTDRDLQVHLFGLSHIPPITHRFLEKISAHIPVNYYMLSPCQKFWSDILSDRESQRLQRYWKVSNASENEQHKLEEFLQDRNPLLANLGRLGREMASQIESSEAAIYEKYALPESVLSYPQYQEEMTSEISLQKSTTSLTLLQAVQADIALLRDPASQEKIAFDLYDQSLQVHAAAKPMREVQIVYDSLMALIEKHQQDNDPILPGDIFVMAPDIVAYAPWIRSVFQSPDSLLDIHLIDKQLPGQHPLILAYRHLIQLPLGRWDIGSIIQLLEYPAFQLRHGLKVEEISLVLRWIKEAGVRWGKDAAHRNELLKRDHCEKEMGESWSGTWEHGLGRLLEGLAMVPDDSSEAGEFYPIEGIETSQGEILGKVLSLLRSLMIDLKPLIDQSRLTLREWSMYLKCLCDAYLRTDGEFADSYKLLLDQFASFGRVHENLQEESYPFHSIQRHLVGMWEQSTASQRESNSNVVRFSSLLPMRTIPAKVVVLMGMNDGAFPRSDQASSLNLLLESRNADYFPSRVDADRYVFLEALLSARQYFLLTYTSQEAGEPKECLPSLLVSELMNYVDKSYLLPEGKISDHCIYRHPFYPFHKAYFTEGSRFKSYFQCYYNAALTYYHAEKQLPHTFLPAFSLQSNDALTEPQEVVIDLADLIAFIKNPIKTYLNKSMGIYLEKEESRHLKKDEELLISRLESSKLMREASFISPMGIFQRAEKMGVLPQGPFRAIEKQRMAREVDTLKSNLLRQGINIDQVFSLECSERYKTPIREDNVWHLPPLEMEISSGKTVRIVGRLETVSMQGLLVHADDEMTEAIKIWPTLLFFCCLKQRYALPIESRLIFIKGKKGAKEMAFDEPSKLFVQLLDYYFKGGISPLMPEWVAPLLKGDGDHLQKAVLGGEEEFRPIYDEYLKWLRRSSPGIDLQENMEYWQQEAKSLFATMNAAWYSKT